MSEKKQVKVVIGANFGDEGKGLMTDYFCHQLGHTGKPVLNIRYNGGANAAHNVVTPDGVHHTFSHFGSGSFHPNADTYLGEDFILNPILFWKELDHLFKLGVQPKVYIHENCRITIPYDMMINQIVETRRGDGRHGSCGLGIDETVQRYNTWKNQRAKDAKSINKGQLQAFRLFYVTERLYEHGVAVLTDEEYYRIQNNKILDNYLTQLTAMLNYCTICDDNILRRYDRLVFEGAQGLLLDQDYLPFEPHLTSSKTGSATPKKMLLRKGLAEEDIEFCYVTRSYFTRHGAGPFPSECDASNIFKKERIEKHNVENEFQGKFRYGYFDRKLFLTAVDGDNKNMIYGFPNSRMSIAVTHLDETGGETIVEKPLEKKGPMITPDYRYASYGPTRCDVVRW